MMSIINKKEPNKEGRTYTDDTFIDIKTYRIHEKIIHNFYEDNMERLFQKCNTEITPYLPHIISSPMPNRLNNLNFTVAFRSAHRMELFSKDNKIKCICQKNIDKYGYHFFTALDTQK